MRNFMLLTGLLIIVALTACSHFKVAEIDPKTGYLPSTTKAAVVTKEKYDLDSMKDLILVPSDPFMEGQVKNLKYFDHVINFDELQARIIHENLQDKISSVSDKLGLNRAYTIYRPFLWLRYHERRDEAKRYGQFILTDPKEMKDIFIAEEQLRIGLWSEIDDQHVWYPLFNALIDYIKDNSHTYQRP